MKARAIPGAWSGIGLSHDGLKKAGIWHRSREVVVSRLDLAVSDLE